jgi:general secretion pathway protein F
MSSFAFRARRRNGPIEEGKIFAADLAQARIQLTGRGLVPEVIKPCDESPSSFRSYFSRRKLSLDDQTALFQDWARLLEAGLSIEEAVGVSASSREKTRAGLVSSAIQRSLKEGRSFDDALADNMPELVPSTRAVLRAAQAAGALPDALQRIAAAMFEARKLARSIRSAMIYPCLVLSVAGGAIAILLGVVVPSIEGLVKLDDPSTPFLSKLVIRSSQILRDYGDMVAIAIAVLALALAWFSKTQVGRLALDQVLLRLPLLGPTTREIQNARFASVLGLLIAGGVPLARAVGLAVSSIGNVALAKQASGLQRAVAHGEPFGDTLARSGIMTREAIAMVRVGERSGRLEQMLSQVAVVSENRAEERLKLLIASIGPLLTIICGLIAGVIVYAVMATTMNISDMALR